MIDSDAFVDWFLEQDEAFVERVSCEIVRQSVDFLCGVEDPKFSSISEGFGEITGQSSLARSVKTQMDQLANALDEIYESETSQKDLFVLDVLQTVNALAVFLMGRKPADLELGAEAFYRTTEYSTEKLPLDKLTDLIERWSNERGRSANHFFNQIYAALQ